MIEPRRVSGERLYRFLVACAYPARFRRRGGPELMAVFRQGRRAADARGPGAVATFWLRTLADLACTAPREWADSAAALGRGVMLLGRDPVRELGLAAWRLGRAPGHAVLAVLTLAVGLASMVTVYSVVRGVLLQPLAFEEPGRIVRLREADGEGRLYWPSYPNFVDWRERSRALGAITALEYPRVRPVRLPGGAARVSVAGAGRDFLRTLGVRPARGRGFTGDENRPGGPPVAMVDHGFWRDRLGAAPLEGLTLGIDGESFDVVAVLPRGFRVFDAVEVWTPLERRKDLGQRGSHGYHVLGRLAGGHSLDDLRREMNAIASALKEIHGADTQAAAVLTTRLRDDLVEGVERPLALLLVAAALVFGVACLNLATTVLARGMARSRELAVRLALGARRADLVRHLLAETGVMALPGAVVGSLLAAAALAYLRRVAVGLLPRAQEVSLDASALLTGLVLSLLAALVAGTVPALVLARRDVAGRLRGRDGTDDTRRQRRLWNGFLAAQVALTVVLVVGSGLLLRSLWTALSVDLGYRPEGVVAVDVTLPEYLYPDGPSMTGCWGRALEELRSRPDVAAAGLVNVLPTETQALIGMAWPAGDQDNRVWAGWRMVDPGFFATLEIPVNAGDWGLRLDGRGGPVPALVSEGLADRLWPKDDPRGESLGNSFGWREGRLRVAGEVGEVREWWQDPGWLGAMYVDYRAAPEATRTMHLVVRGGAGLDVGSLAATVRGALEEVDPEVPVTVGSLQERIGEGLADRRLALAVLLGFALAALLLAAVAVYGAVSYTVARRTREVGIRRALGARPGQVRRRVALGGLLPVTAGLAVGLLAALGLGPLLSAYLFEVAPEDPAAFLAAPLLLLLAATLAAWLPARRAARVDPLEALRLDG